MAQIDEKDLVIMQALDEYGRNVAKDKITKHEYLVILKEYSPSNIVLLIDCKKVVLEWIKYDEVWNKWHNHYIASFGINMDKDEKIGKIKPNIFPGIYDHYYVELRLPQIL